MRPFGQQIAVYQKALDRFAEAQKLDGKLDALAGANEAIAAAVKAIAGLGPLSASGISDIGSAIDNVKGAVKSGTFESSDWPSLMRQAFTAKDTEALKFYLPALVSSINSLNEVLNTTRQVIQQKDADIFGEIETLKARSSLFGLGVIAFAIILAIVVASVLSNGIARAMRRLGKTVSDVSSGDLRLRFNSTRTDELGVLAQDIDALLESLTGAFARIQAASSENLTVKDELVSAVSTATSSAVEIQANSASILGQLERVDQQLKESGQDLNRIVELLGAFRRRLTAQGDEVDSAQGSVEELAQSIDAISGLSDENRREVDILLEVSDRGKDVFDRSFAKVAEVNASVSNIQELVEAIGRIAEQTNTLSLNAAIEAAHAGEAGKGFAVVADEISKLAKEAAETSEMITRTIREVVGKIIEAGATREETLGTLNQIESQIVRVSERSRSIDTEAGQMNKGAQRIRSTMDMLVQGSGAATTEADRVGEAATNLENALSQLGRISHEVVSNIGEITIGLSEISRTVNEVNDQAERLGRVGVELDQSVNAFQTK
jgi:methyl-accepting chemotaxis protein